MDNATMLKPCPFCGGEAEYVRPNEYECFLFIRCKRCKTKTKPIGVDFYTQKYSYEKLAERWNRRVNVIDKQKVRQVLLEEFGEEETEAIDALMERMK